MNKKVILYIDDEPINLELFKMMFKDEYEIYTVINVKQGLDILKKNPHINIVISDWNMPEMNGLDFCIKNGADVIVNTDADNQYCADDISKLVEPILNHRAEFVIGSRPISTIDHFSFIKKALQLLGSWVVRVASNTTIPDAPSGFRAITRSAAKQMMVFNEYTYTLETIIQAGQKNISIASVPIRVNGDLRPSRLVKSIPSYIKKSIFTIVRIFIIYRPFRFFGAIGLSMFFVGVFIGLLFLKHYFLGDGNGHIQSLILSAVFLIMGFQAILVAFIADLLAANRKLIEDLRSKILDTSDSEKANVWIRAK
jgi:hypothetical protein